MQTFIRKHRAALREALVLGAVSVGIYVLALLVDLERLMIRPLGVFMTTLMLALALFALRRWQEAERELTRREQLERELIRESEARQESQEAYQALVNHSPQAIVIYQDDRIVFANPAVASLLGYSIEELLDLQPGEIAALVHPDDREVAYNWVRDHLARKTVPTRYVLQAYHRSGQTRWIQVTLNHLDYRGKPAVLATITDITELKWAQDAVQENVLRAHLRDELSMALARAGSDVQAVFDTLARTLGVVIGDSCTVILIEEEWLHPVAFFSTDPQMAARRAQLLERRARLSAHPFGRAVKSGEGLLITAAGLEPEETAADPLNRVLSEFRPSSRIVAPLRSGSQMMGLVELTRYAPNPPHTPRELALAQELSDRAAYAMANADLLRRVAAELATRRAVEAKYRTLVEQVPAITYVAASDHVGKTLYISPQVEQLGFTPEEWIADPDFWANHIHPDDRARMLAQAQEARRNNVRVETEYRLLARDGRVHSIVEHAARLLHAPAGGFYLAEPEQRQVRLVISYNTRRDYTGTVLEYGEGVAGRVVELGEPLIIPNAVVVNLRDVTGRVARERACAASAAAEREQRLLAQALRDSAAVLNSTLDYDQVLDHILEQVGRVVPHETATLFLLEGAEFRVARARGFERYGLAEWILNLRMLAEQEKFRNRLEQGLTLVVSDTTTFPEWTTYPQTRWIRSHLSAPIRTKGAIVGVLNLDSTLPGFFTEDHAARLAAFADHAGLALENARLHLASERRAREMATLYETTRELAWHVELSELLPTIVARALQLLHAPQGAMFIYESAARELQVVVQMGLQLAIGARFALGEGVAGRVALTHAPLIVEDYAHWDGQSAQVEASQLAAVMGVPMLFGGDLIGVLVVSDSAPTRRFSQDEMQSLTLFAAQAASAIHSARLLERAGQRAEQLALLYDASVTLNRALDLPTQLRFLFQLASRALHAEHISFFRFNPARAVLEFEAGTGLTPELQAHLSSVTFSVRLEENWMGWVAARRVPVRVSHPAAAPQWQPLDPRMQSALCVPVEHEKQLHGVLIAVSAKPDAFSAADERLLILFANQVAAAIETAGLLEQEQERRAELERRLEHVARRAQLYEQAPPRTTAPAADPPMDFEI